MADFPNEGVDMDELFNRPFDEESAAEVETASLVPEGYYLTNPDEYPVLAFPFLFDNRRIITIMARVEGKVVGEFHSTLLRFKISPDKKHAVVWENGQPTDQEKSTFDMASVLWTQTRNVYKAMVGDGPKTEKALIEFLKTQPVKVKVGHFNGKLTAKGIEKAR